MRLRIFVVSHTHWDREWYLTQTQFQMMGVDMMKRLLSMMETQPSFGTFMLDGQLIALEDYLAVCPEDHDRLGRLIREGRLAIGPWYVLPDEYLASGEAHIRNFMEGMAQAQALGGGMRLGYLPDSFGHPSQMPQVIAGLGMAEMIFWRGPGPEVTHAEFEWVGKDGTAILALNMMYGYSNAACLPTEEAGRHERLLHEIDKLACNTQLGLVLLMNGSDHIAADGRVVRWIADFQKTHPELDIRLTSLDAYVCAAQERRRDAALQTVHGELRSGYRAYLLGDTLSTRMPLKQAQRRMETLLENRLEPLFTLLALGNLCAYPAGPLHALWKLLLQNLPHDSICGCGVDAVHQEMMSRYRRMEDIGGHLLQTAARALHCDKDGQAQADGEVTVASLHLHPAIRQVQATLERVIHPLRYVDYAQDQRLLEFEGEDDAMLPTGVLLTGPDGRTIRATVEETTFRDTLECDPMTQPVMNRVLSVACAFTDEFPPLCLTRYRYCFTYEAQPVAVPRLENQHLAVEAAADGTLSVLCKATGLWHHGLLQLSDVADVGDAYTFDGLPNDQPIVADPASVRRTCGHGQLTIRSTLRLPQACSQDRRSRGERLSDCAVTVVARLPDSLARVELSVTVDNQACDHRLMALFPLDTHAESVLCDSLFALEKRPIIRAAATPHDDQWMEKPNNSFFQKNFADLSAGGHGLCVMVRGLPQCDVQTDATHDQLRVTLLRCVGWLSRKDLASRKGNGGWSLPTPGAQALGAHTFELALMPHAACEPYELYQAALDYAAPPAAMQTSRCGAARPDRSIPFCRTDDRRIALSALKAAENGDGTILRLHNMSDATVETALHFPWFRSITAEALSLDERPQGGIHTADATLRLVWKAWQIRTIRVKGGLCDGQADPFGGFTAGGSGHGGTGHRADGPGA